VSLQAELHGSANLYRKVTAIPTAQRIPWPRVLIEGVVIVASILLAFGIDAAWQDRTDRGLESDLIAAIERDMRQNLDEADRVLAGHAVRSAALRVVLDTPPAELSEISEDSTRSVLRRLALVQTFTPFDGSIRTGDLSVLRDPALRAAIGAWAGIVADATETTELLFGYARDLRPTFGEPALRQMTGLTSQDTRDRPLAELRADQDFVRSALAMEMTILAYRSKVTRVKSETEALLELLRN
jgi:hypothetical protein